jgi:8-hydroxy-5-deazaflavin:NADPH oxidoreductase
MSIFTIFSIASDARFAFARSGSPIIGSIGNGYIGRAQKPSEEIAVQRPLFTGCSSVSNRVAQYANGEEACMAAQQRFDPRRRSLLVAGGAIALGASSRPRGALAQPSAKTPIGVIGSGHIGSTVGGLWVKAGHPVLFSSRHPDELKDMVDKLGALAKAGTVAEAIAFGDALLIAVPYGALPRIGEDNRAALKGKVVLDACNAVASRDGDIAAEVERNGIGVTSQKYLPGTHVVRAFNTLSYMILAREANRANPRLAIPVAGDDAAAVRMAEGLVRDAGFDPVVVGKLADASRFQRGGPGYGQNVSAAELKRTLSLAP